jgi:hypothetical protein
VSTASLRETLERLVQPASVDALGSVHVVLVELELLRFKSICE